MAKSADLIDRQRKEAMTHTRERLATGGLEAVKARDVAAALNVSVGTLYNLFGDLDALLFATNATVYDDLAALIDARMAALPATASLADQLETLALAYASFVNDHQMLWSAVLAFNVTPKDQTPSWYLAKERMLLDKLGGVIEASFPPGDPAAAVAARTLWASTQGILSLAVGAEGVKASPEEIQDQLRYLVRMVAQDLSSRGATLA